MNDENVIDFGARALGRMRERLTALDEANACLVTSTRVHLEAVEQVHAAALSLFDASSLDHFVHIVTQDWTDTLGLDAVSLGLLSRLHPATAGTARMALVDPDLLTWRANGHGAVRFDTGDDDADDMLKAALFGPACALIRRQALVQLSLPEPLPPGLLALGSRGEFGCDGRTGAQLLGFLGAVTSHLLARWLTSN